MNDIDSYLFQKDVDPENYIIATYRLTTFNSKDFVKSAKAIAIGQTIGNPDIRTQRDTPQMLKDNLAKITEIHLPTYLTYTPTGIVKIAYPIVNFGEGDGITQLLCALMGGQMDIDIITGCRLIDIEFPESYEKTFFGPRFGMDEIKKRTGAINRPLLGGIVKPKTGISIKELVALVQELLEGGVDFIKEDEILGNPKFCSFVDRVPIIADLVKEYEQKQNREIFYAPCINGDNYLERAKFAAKNGMKIVHLNFWAGLSAYKVLREEPEMKNTAIFFQKSGDKVLSENSHAFGIDFHVICKLARMSGVDFIHAGMWGGYLSTPKEELDKIMHSLRSLNKFKPTIPSLSCGSHPGLVDTTVANYGTDLMMNVGGAIQGHPKGTTAGAKAMRQAMDKPVDVPMEIYMQDKPELKSAIEKWGYVKP